jgi:hypothetical protein
MKVFYCYIRWNFVWQSFRFSPRNKSCELYWERFIYFLNRFLMSTRYSIDPGETFIECTWGSTFVSFVNRFLFSFQKFVLKTSSTWCSSHFSLLLSTKLVGMHRSFVLYNTATFCPRRYALAPYLSHISALAKHKTLSFVFRRCTVKSLQSHKTKIPSSCCQDVLDDWNQRFVWYCYFLMIKMRKDSVNLNSIL